MAIMNHNRNIAADDPEPIPRPKGEGQRGRRYELEAACVSWQVLPEAGTIRDLFPIIISSDYPSIPMGDTHGAS